MKNLQQFYPGMNHVLCGRPPKTSLAQMEAKLRSYRESSLSELMHILELGSPFRDSNPRRRKPTLGGEITASCDVLGIFVALTPCTPCLEVVRKVQSFCSELKLRFLAQVTSPTARRAGDWPAKI